jgi:hypothetical protein
MEHYSLITDMAKMTRSGKHLCHYVFNKFHIHRPGLETMNSKPQQIIIGLPYSTAKAHHKMQTASQINMSVI